MSLNISFDPAVSKGSNSRLVLRVGDVMIRSYPMSVNDHYSDLAAIKHFLGNGRLSSIFLGDEPLAQVEIQSENDKVVLKPYGRLEEELVFGEFSLSQGLTYIEGVLDGLAAAITIDRDSLQAQVDSDIDQGVYDVYLNKPHARD